MKKNGFTSTLILALLISTLTFTVLVQVASANPFMPSGSWSSEPIPPSIEVQSQNGALTYWNGSDVWLNFTVTKPVTNWYSAGTFRYPDYYATTFGNLSQVRFSVDGQQEKVASSVSESKLKKYALYNPLGGILQYSVNLGWLPVGNHTINIIAEGRAYFGNLTHSAFSDSFPIDTDSSDKTKPVQSSLKNNFVVDGVAPIPPPESFPTLPVLAGLTAVVVVASVGLLVYFKKHSVKVPR